jgi:hypothetical protein
MHFATFLIIPKEEKVTEDLIESYMEKYGQDSEQYREFSLEISKKDMPKEARRIINDLIKNPNSTIEDLFNKIQIYKKQFAERNYIEIVKEENGYKENEGNLGYYFNPNTIWDWYVIGGRWSNYLSPKDIDINNIDTYKNDTGNNVRTIKYYRNFLKHHPDKTPHYIITYKTDEYIDVEGWKDKETLDYLKDYDEKDKIVVIDCHN